APSRSADTSLTTHCNPWERLMGPKRVEPASAYRARQSILCALIVLTAAAPALGQAPIPGTTIPCAPLSERAGRGLGCWGLGRWVVGRLPGEPVYWHLLTPIRNSCGRDRVVEMHQRGASTDQKSRCPHITLRFEEAPLMRLSVGTLRQVVKRDLSIAFVPQQLTSYGGLELLRRYLHRLHLPRRLHTACAMLGGDYGGARLGLLLMALLYIGA